MSDEQTSGEQQKWEYKVVREHSFYGPDIDAFLERMGQDGWEMVGVTDVRAEFTSTSVTYYFKRPFRD